MNEQTEYKNRGLTVDALIVQDNAVLLIKRKNEPYQGYWALPGGFVEWNETVEEALTREVKEETGLETLQSRIIGIYSQPDRHPKQVIAIAFGIDYRGEPVAGDDAEALDWFPVNSLPSNLAFDHRDMIEAAQPDNVKKTEKRVVFAAMSKRNFYLREHIIKFILQQGYTPTSAFMMYSYFLLGTVERQALISANNDLIKISDELWVFGEISGGVRKEIDLSRSLGQPIKYYNVDQFPDSIHELSEEDALQNSI